MRPTVLLDVDEVMIDWLPAFTAWMAERGHRAHPEGSNHYDLVHTYPGLVMSEIAAEIDAFGRSPQYGKLPLRDGVMIEIGALAVAGCEVHAVTACGRDPQIVSNRHYQLRGLPLTSIIPVEHSEGKESAYLRFPPGSVVVDDSPHHLQTARGCGHVAVAYDAPWNRGAVVNDRLFDWSFGAIRIIRNLRFP